jgi:hypothetical protein
MFKNVTAIEFIKNTVTGKTSPIIVQCDDVNSYVLKPKSRNTIKNIFGEFFCSWLLCELNEINNKKIFYTPEISFIKITKMFINIYNEANLQKLENSDIGLNFGSLLLDN